MSRDVPTPSYNDEANENPRRFLKEFEEFAKLKGVTQEWKISWFRRCLGEKTRLWFDAVEKDTENFEVLEKKFLDRFWSEERQSDTIRRLYTPGVKLISAESKETYLLSAWQENSYLDNPLTERSLIGAVSRQMGAEIAKHVLAGNISTIESFAKLLNAWERVEKGQGHVISANAKDYTENNRRDVPKGNWRNMGGRNYGYNEERGDVPEFGGSGRRGQPAWDKRPCDFQGTGGGTTKATGEIRNDEGVRRQESNLN